MYTNRVYLAISNAYPVLVCVCDVRVCMTGGAKAVMTSGLWPMCHRKKEREEGDER